MALRLVILLVAPCAMASDPTEIDQAGDHQSRVHVNDAVLIAITVQPEHVIIPIGAAVQFTAIGLYTDGTERDITDQVKWSASGNTVKFDSTTKGLAVGKAITTTRADRAKITASKQITYKAKNEQDAEERKVTIIGHSAIQAKRGIDRFMCDYLVGGVVVLGKKIARWFGNSQGAISTPDACTAPIVLHQFAHENDSFAFRGQDKFYTGGTFYEQVYFGGMNYSDTERENIGFRIGQLVYTSSDVESAQPSRIDRPFAGYIYGGVFWEEFERDSWSEYLRLQADFGCIGRCSFAEGAQTIVHDLLTIGSPTPQGWRDQVAQQPGVNLNLTLVPKFGEWSTRHPAYHREVGIQGQPAGSVSLSDVIREEDKFDRLKVILIDIAPIFRFNWGSFFTNASLELKARMSLIGRMRSYFEAGSLTSTATSALGDSNDFNLNLFASYKIERVDHNALLEGARGARYEFRREPDRTVREVAAGIQFGKGGFGLSYTYTIRSSEIREGLLDENHTFGKLQFSFVTPFN